MTIEILSRDKDEAGWTPDKIVYDVGKVINYLRKSKDVEMLKNSPISRIVTFDHDVWFKVYWGNEMMCIDVDCIKWLESHHYMWRPKYNMEECHRFWDLIKGHVDMYKIEDWAVKNDSYLSLSDITYDKDGIYVNGKATGMPFSYELIKFVVQNKTKWL